MNATSATACERVDPAEAATATGLPCITVVLCGNQRKHVQSFDALRVEAEAHNAALLRGRPSWRDDGARDASMGVCEVLARDMWTPSRLSSARIPSVFFRLVNLNYDASNDCMVLCADATIRGEMPATAHAQTPGCDAASACALDQVDVLLHKVASYGTPRAARALERFMASVNAARAASRGRARPPLVVIDPLAKVDVLTTRCVLYRLLDSAAADGRPTALIPRTFRWELSSETPAQPHITPVGDSSLVPDLHDEACQQQRANGLPGETWWIAKPDEGTGPSFTHHLVLWKSERVDPDIPSAVRDTLPKEASAFVVQEYYLFSLPVVLKVYVVGEHVFVKVSPTVKLLTMLETQLAQHHARVVAAGTGDARGLDTPIFMDSQDKEMFTAAGLPTASRSPSTTAALTPEVSGAAFSSTPDSAAPETLSDTARSALPDEVLLRAVVPTELWDTFLSPGTAAHAHIKRLARSLSEPDAGLGLSMFGFDVVLVPHHLAHAQQRAACPRGFGYPPFATHRHDAAAKGTTPPPPPPPPCGSVFAWGPDSMFDLETGAPTPLLLESVPVVIDVNYFPGYKGMSTANANVLALATQKVAREVHAVATFPARDEPPHDLH